MRLLPAVLLLACTSAPDRRPPITPEPASARGPANAPVAAAPLLLESRYRVSWGHGCGGNCAQNTRGASTVRVTARGADATVEDAGDTSTTFSGPGSLTSSSRAWQLSWRGSLDDGDTAMTLRLTSGSGRCEESQDKGTVDCKHPPPTRLVVACTRAELDVSGAKRAAWRCEPDPPIPDSDWSGTPFPWVFGIDDPIDTVHAGEPQPTTRYQLRADH